MPECSASDSAGPAFRNLAVLVGKAVGQVALIPHGRASTNGEADHLEEVVTVPGPRIRRTLGFCASCSQPSFASGGGGLRPDEQSSATSQVAGITKT
jgi:hypothetical protein